MINVAIDEKACVGCSLCVETCLTGVFTFNEARSVPEVAKLKECFGCLVCSEICPAEAIDHTGVPMSASFYHDPYALELAAKMTTGPRRQPNVLLDKEGRKQALRDLGVRLLAVAAVFKQTLGAGLPAVGTLAGRTLATQLPRYKAPKSLGATLALAKEQFSPAWELSLRVDGADRLTINIKECFVRDLCTREGIELGGELCILFYNYLAGYLGKMGGARLKLIDAERGAERCTYSVKLY